MILIGAQTYRIVLTAKTVTAKATHEHVWQLTYNDGKGGRDYHVRVVKRPDGWIRKEFKFEGDEWAVSGKPYIVRKDRRRVAEKIIDIVEKELKSAA